MLTPGSWVGGSGGGAGLTSSQAWEGTELVQVLGHLLPQVFEGATIKEQSVKKP